MPFANDCLDSGYTSLRDVPELTVDQCTVGELKFTLTDPRTGAAFDLTEFGIGGSSSSGDASFTGTRLVLKEMPWSSSVWRTADLTTVDAANGEVQLDYDDKFTQRAGIFTAEVQIWEGGAMRRIIQYFFIITPSLTGERADTQETLTIAEIRMTMRDTDPGGNYLLDELDFKENEIALAIRRCVDYWNEARPPVMSNMTPATFPWRYHLSRGVVGELHNWAAINKMRNDLPYQSAGVTVQDTVKWLQYREIGDKLWNEWRQWVKEKKYEINVMGAFSTLGSGYQYAFFPR